MRSSSLRACGATPVVFPWIVAMDFRERAADGGVNQGPSRTNTRAPGGPAQAARGRCPAEVFCAPQATRFRDSPPAVAKLTPMTLGEARTALESYDLDVVAVEALDAGSVNSNFAVQTQSGERFFVRVYEEQDFDGAMAELARLQRLYEN